MDRCWLAEILEGCGCGACRMEKRCAPSQDMQARLTQRYAYHVARAKLEAQGFALVTEETQLDGQMHLVLQRMA